MKKGIKYLIYINIITMIIYCLIGYSAKAIAIDMAYGEEIEEIGEPVGAVGDTIKTWPETAVKTPKSTTTILSEINTYLKENINTGENKTGNMFENWLNANIYNINHLFSLKYLPRLDKGEDAEVESPHGMDPNMNDYIDFSEATHYEDDPDAFTLLNKKPQLKKDPTKFKDVYDAGSGRSNSDIKTPQITYSNYNAKRIYPYWKIQSNKLIEIDNHHYKFENAYKIPYIVAFSDNTDGKSFINDVTKAQDALWAVTGETSRINDLYKAAFAVEDFINVQVKAHKEVVKVSIPDGAQAGTVYIRDNDDISADYGGSQITDDNIEYPTYDPTFDASRVVRVGPFTMGDYAYSFSKYVEDYSNKGLDYPHVIGGIVGGRVSINGVEYEIGDGTGDTVRIVYKDWHDEVPYDYVGMGIDVRGDNTRFSEESVYTYQPEFEGKYSYRKANPGSEEKYTTTTHNPTNADLKVEIYANKNSTDKSEYYPFPLPNSTFYIEVSERLCGEGNATMNSITFDYRSINVDGHGDVIITRAAKATTKFSQSASSTGDLIESSCNYYTCQDSTGSGNCSFSKNPGSSSTPHSGCTHTWYTGCYKTSCPGKDCEIDYYTSCPGKDCKTAKCNCPKDANGTVNCTKDHSYCPGNCTPVYTCPGDCTHAHGEYHTYTHNDPFLCKHGHANCSNGHWETTIDGTEYGQPLLIVEDAKVEVKLKEYPKTVNVAMFVEVETICSPVFIWHGWDEGWTFMENKEQSGFFDFTLLNFWDPKPMEIGDRVTFRVGVQNNSNEQLYLWQRQFLPYNMKADDVSDVKIRTLDLIDTVSDWVRDWFGDGWDTKFRNPSAGDMQTIVMNGVRYTKSALLLVDPGDSVTYFLTFRLTDDVETDEDGNLYSPFTDLTSDNERYYKIDSDHSWNKDFARTDYDGGDPRHWGPVMIREKPWTPPPLIHKTYVLNVNKYISEVEHTSDLDGRIDTSFDGGQTMRGYEVGEGEEILLSQAALQKTHDDTEKAKKDNPVYVEYGDKVTYTIEVSNTKVSGREDDPYYDPDLVYVTLRDELPEKYDNLEIILEDPGAQKDHYEQTIETTGGRDTIVFKDLMIPKNGTTKITVSFTVEEKVSDGKLIENKAYISLDEENGECVYNYNRGDKKEPENEKLCNITKYVTVVGTSSDWYVLNDYNLDMDKYISAYNQSMMDANRAAGLSNEVSDISRVGFSKGTTSQKANEDRDRMDQANLDKENNPVHVEQTEKVIYSIKLENNPNSTGGTVANGGKYETQIRPVSITETLDTGLVIEDVQAIIYKSGGDSRYVREVAVTRTGNTGTVEIKLKDPYGMDSLLEADEFIVFYVTVRITEDNMSLRTLRNTATIAKVTNVNSVQPSRPEEDREITDQNKIPKEGQTSEEYVRMKDLIIGGYVWLDKDRDGFMEDEDANLLTAEEKDRYSANGAKAGKAGVTVKLYRVGEAEAIRTTVSDTNGRYSFNKQSSTLSEYSSLNAKDEDGKNVAKPYNLNETYTRIDKANNKDSYGNYTGNNQLYQYYIEFEYDGILYKSTEIYASRDRINADGSYQKDYEIDSNAAEKFDERKSFNGKYEYISYNSAYVAPGNKMADLKFKKEGHISLLEEDMSRKVKARSFIDKVDLKTDDFLWFFGTQGGGKPETEYLKYINLGLELREEVDISLTKDVYKVKTTINGESMEYNFNENYALNGVGAGLGGTNPTDADNEYLNDFIIAKPYGLELYESDYKYRVDQYFADKVIEYKGIESELNVEVTYRITVDNKPISDADDVKYGDGKDYVTETALNVKVNEIMDVYEDNFIKYGARPNNEITVKTKTEEGTLDKLIVKTIEAWYYKDVGAGNGNYRRIVEETETQKPIYEEYAGGGYERVDLTVSDTSIFKDNTVNYSSYGYNKLYITGMGGETISENDDLDIYVKYTLDKEKATLEQNNTNYSETISEKTTEYTSATLGDAYATYQKTMEVDTTNSTVVMERSLKIMESVLRDKSIERGIENIAQVNAYSVWYADGSPASLVDRNSNAGNLINPDNIATFEDTTYKTGIVIVAEGTGWDKEEVLTKIDENIEFKGSPDLKRIIDGVVWDDVRNDTLGSGAETQYVGDGLKNDILQTNEDLMNENVEINYRPTDNIKEDKDFGIRNIKAEFIEIVKIPDPTSETGERYYEQVLEEVTWQQVQNDRTDIDGKYELEGFIPGTYIVRFTYGDVVKENEGKEGDAFDPTIQAQNDMIIFNGQDYKSTTAQVINETEMDDIIDKLEIEGGSDARDDERRRLEVNSYSEIMTNPKAEILKGTGNGALRTNADGTTESITTNTEKNSRTELKTLVDNTYMYADTIEFLVKPEKLTNDQITDREDLRKVLLGNDYKVSYEDLMDLLRKETNERTFRISNIDFGIEYRPESEIRLVKEIEEVKLITENGETLVDLYFLTKGEGNDTKHEIDKTRSKGVELVQFVTNDYNVLLNKLTNEEKQGFVFVQVDEEILQGCTVQIIYKFEAENNSEVDRIAVSLDKIRYKENQAAKDLLEKYEKARVLALTNYTASGIAAKVVETDMYKIEEGPQKLEYRIRPKTMVEEGMTEEQIKQAYYGKYVGYGYYTGEESSLDTIASLKFDKILDYVDVNLEYKQESEQVATLDKFWTRVKTEDLKTLLYPVRSKLETNPGNPVEELQNGRGYTYDTLLVSVDDRIKDDKYSTKYSSFTINEEADNIRNNSLSRFLLPKDTVVDKTDAEELSKAVATIRLPVSKVLSAETDKNDMSYENMAEIVQFTTLTGRRTNFATTIGNADIESIIPDEGIGTLEFVTATLESDTAATETVTLIPPTGLMRNRRAIVNIVEATSVGVGFIFVLGTVAVILIVIITVILFVIRKYKKRRII